MPKTTFSESSNANLRKEIVQCWRSAGVPRCTTYAVRQAIWRCRCWALPALMFARFLKKTDTLTKMVENIQENFNIGEIRLTTTALSCSAAPHKWWGVADQTVGIL
ncbi:hypothetical protein Y032_0330g2694 [Ancylostoma ceylanicum]|uniref:Uncharacterized protein n=1 Tax=Ancylostoma ceylanicum TaxID=53326 RepID=A0A016S0D4_9BILA|nr:hypothetical protein Y032_0330g2694 [Ancylostoma ceylanicum]